MSIGYAYELPAGEPGGAVADALAEVQAGQTAYLTRDGTLIAGSSRSPSSPSCSTLGLRGDRGSGDHEGTPEA